MLHAPHPKHNDQPGAQVAGQQKLGHQGSYQHEGQNHGRHHLDRPHQEKLFQGEQNGAQPPHQLKQDGKHHALQPPPIEIDRKKFELSHHWASK